VPRPTLYRYLREYSIPHVRQAGRITIPEDSVDLIREARELHEEGMSIDSVRRRLREGEVDFKALMDRLDDISGSLEDLRQELPGPNRAKATDDQAIATLSERVDSLISAVFTLTEISERLLSDMQSLKERPASAGETSASAERLEAVESELAMTRSRVESLSTSVESLLEMTTYVVNVASVLKNNSGTPNRQNSS
jgi:chromosome segregation ATPase